MNNQKTQSAQREARSAPPHGSAKWLIWSNEHRAYWRPNMAGYTTFAKAAGRYTYTQAIEICRDARSHGDDGTPPPETMITEDCISPNAALCEVADKTRPN
jgi:hypothetical protein